jgi:hypothetical protein
MIQIEARTIRELRNKIIWLKGLLTNANDCQSLPTPFFLVLMLSPRRKGRKEKRERFISLYNLQYPLRSLRLCESHIHTMER